MIVTSFYTLLYLVEKWRYVKLSAKEKSLYDLQVLPYYVVLGISVSKIFVSIAWYRMVFRKNTIDLTMDLFKLRVVWDVVTLGGIMIFSIMGLEAVWEAMAQCLFQAFV
jgi:hypothetical protein